MKKDASLLTLQNLHLSRMETPILKDFSLSLQAGEIYWVLGKNGSGKTSLLKVAAGLLAVETGQILWQGVSLPEARATGQMQIHYLGHLHGIKAQLSVEENLYLAQSVTGFTVQRDLGSVLEKMGLIAKRHTLCRELSAGQQQRVALARLIYLSAPLWILDEPFTSLDEEGSKVVAHLFLQHLKQGGTIFASTHRLLEEKIFSYPAQHFITLAAHAREPI